LELAMDLCECFSSFESLFGLYKYGLESSTDSMSQDNKQDQSAQKR